MSFQDLLKFAIQEAVKQMEKPESDRVAEKEKKKLEKEPLSHWAFGLAPFAFSFIRRRLKQK